VRARGIEHVALHVLAGRVAQPAEAGSRVAAVALPRDAARDDLADARELDHAAGGRLVERAAGEVVLVEELAAARPLTVAGAGAAVAVDLDRPPRGRVARRLQGRAQHVACADAGEGRAGVARVRGRADARLVAGAIADADDHVARAVEGQSG